MKTNDTIISEASERELAAGVLKQAAHELRRFHGATTAVEWELYQDAYSWVMSDDSTWPFSFLNVCRLLNRRPDDLREEVLGELSLGALKKWAGGGAERFADFRILSPDGLRPAARILRLHPKV